MCLGRIQYKHDENKNGEKKQQQHSTIKKYVCKQVLSHMYKIHTT